jgi:hypothetical protein
MTQLAVSTIIVLLLLALKAVAAGPVAKGDFVGNGGFRGLRGQFGLYEGYGQILEVQNDNTGINRTNDRTPATFRSDLQHSQKTIHLRQSDLTHPKTRRPRAGAMWPKFWITADCSGRCDANQ